MIKKTLVNLYKDIVLVTRVRIFGTTLFTNNNIKIVIGQITRGKQSESTVQNCNAPF